MSLHTAVFGVVSAVNPKQLVSVQFSEGYATAPDFSRHPTYSAPFALLGQIQPLTYPDLRYLEQLNLQGAQQSVYLSGHLQGVIRVSQQGGDLVTFPDGSVWLTVQVIERWPQWVKAAVRLQNAGSVPPLPPSPPPPPPSPPAFVPLGNLTSYALINGTYDGQQVWIEDNLGLALANPITITGQFVSGSQVVLNQAFQSVICRWNASSSRWGLF